MRPVEGGKKTTVVRHVTLTRGHESESGEELSVELDEAERISWKVGSVRLMHSVHYLGVTEHRLLREFVLEG